jgi:hypothetical protein
MFGRVLQDSEGRPAAGAELGFATLFGFHRIPVWHRALTGPDGRFRTDPMPAPAHAGMVFQPAGFVLDQDLGASANPEASGARMLVLRRGGSLEVTVVNHRDEPVPGVLVDLEATASQGRSADMGWRLHSGSGLTDAQGRAHFPGVAANREYAIHGMLTSLALQQRDMGRVTVAGGPTSSGKQVRVR